MLFLKVVAGVILSNLHGSINSHLSLFVKRGEAGMSSLSKPFKYMREKQEIKAWDVQPIQAFQPCKFSYVLFFILPYSF
jgi:hypothetical protein